MESNFNYANTAGQNGETTHRLTKDPSTAKADLYHRNSDMRLLPIEKRSTSQAFPGILCERVTVDFHPTSALGNMEEDSIINECLSRIPVKRVATPVIVLPLEYKMEGAILLSIKILDEIVKIGQVEPKTPIEHMANEKRTVWFYLKFVVVWIRYYVSYYCAKIVQYPLFETVSLLIILANSVILAMDDPTTSEQDTWQIQADYTFQALYTFELIMKVFAMGFIFNQGAYLRDLWNIMDFLIVVFGYLGYLNISNSNFDIKPLRVVRVLRPLRTITSVEELRILMAALVSSLPLLFDAVLILLFFLSIFAIAGLQLWHGILTKRCMNAETGEYDTDLVCGYATCPAGYVCSDYGQNPNYGVTNFDNFLSALFVVFTAVTQEGWTDTQAILIRAYGYPATIFFSLLILVGAYFLFNFTLAVIKSKVSDIYEQNRKALKEKAFSVAAPAIARSKPLIIGSKRPFYLDTIKNCRFCSPNNTIVPTNKLSRKSTVQTLSLEKYKQLLGIADMEEDDIIIQRKSPSLKEPESEESLLEQAPSQFAKYFKQALRPLPMSKKKVPQQAIAEIPELEDFTDKLLEQAVREEPAEEPREPTFGNEDYSPTKKSINSPRRGESNCFEDPIRLEPSIKKEDEDDEYRPLNTKANTRTLQVLLQSTYKPSQEDLKSSPTENREEGQDLDESCEEEKFVLREGISINLTSEKDVLVPKNRHCILKPSVIICKVPPYKVKLKVAPTELPCEEPEEISGNKGGINVTKEEENKVIRTDRKQASLVKQTRRGSCLKGEDSDSVKLGESKKLGDPTQTQKSVQVTNPRLSESNEVASQYKSLQMNAAVNKTRLAPRTKAPASMLFFPGLLDEMKEDVSTNEKLSVPWSGQEVLVGCDPYFAVWMTNYLSEIRVWKKGMKGLLAKVQHIVKAIVMSETFGALMVLCVLINTAILAMNRYGQPAYEVSVVQTLNTIFTSIFIAEMALKLFSLGIVKYLSDGLNYVDGGVVLLSLIEIVFLDSSQNTSVFRAFQAFRILRALRVVRMVRLLRALRSMQLLIQVIGETLTSFAYIGMLLLVFLFIYSLLGMQLFGGMFDFPDGKPRQNYDSFHNAFLSVYQVLTIENWQSLQYSSMRAQIPTLVALFYVTWLFIGNYVLLNLFLALMLDAFAEVEDEGAKEDDSTNESEMLDNRSTTLADTSKVREKQNAPTVKGETPKSKFALECNKCQELELTGQVKKKNKKPPLHDTDCMFSLYIFTKENPFRYICWKLVTSHYFEWGIIIIIGLSSILLAVDTFYLANPDSSVTDITYGINIFFIACFTLEALIKIIAYGFVFDSGTYLRDLWNILDFLIVVASIIDLSMSSIDIPMIRILRLLRTFRPLRFLSHNQHMKTIVKALFKSLGALCNTMILILMVFMMFSIVGVSFFAGKFQYCTVDTYQNSNKTACVDNGGQWRTYDHNFDNVINGLIYLFELTTQENWPITVYQAIDSTDVDKGPKMDAGWYYAYYYVIFLFVGSMFLMNLFVGVMFYNFSKVQQQEAGTFGGAVANEQQLNWIEVQKLIIRAEPNYNIRTAPSKTSWRAGVHAFITNFYFELFIAIIILLNMVQMAMLYEQESEAYALSLDIVNYVFTGVFTIEIVLKLIGFGMSFWYEPWNVFDFIVVICSYIDIVFTSVTDDSLRMLRVGPQLLRVLRVLRIARLFRLVRKYQQLQAIMEIIQLCLPSIMNVLALLTLILFIYAILGCYLFYNVAEGEVINSEHNFSNFGRALLLCLKISTGEDWNLFMFDCARTSYDCVAGIGCGNWYAYAYFISLKIIVSFIMLNLFVLVVLQLFEKYFIADVNIISTFKEDFDIFQEKWLEAKPSHLGFFIHVDKLRKFFRSLPPKFGFEGNDPDLLAKQILSLDIRSDAEKNVFFNEVLYCTARPLYMKGVRRDAFIQKKEKEARKRILQAAEREAKRSYYSTTRKTFIAKQASPFVSLMKMRMTLKMWRHYKNSHMQRVLEHQKRGEMNYESSIEQVGDDLAVPQKEEDVNTPIVAPSGTPHLRSSSSVNMVNPQDGSSVQPKNDHQ